MKQIKSIQLKAVFLLIIFGLNIVIGFACSVGFDMGFNAHHHNDETTTEVHTHAKGEKQHQEKAGHKHSHKDGNDNCCNDKVLKISQTEKAIPPTAKLLNPVFVTAFITTYYVSNTLHHSQLKVSKKYFESGYDPPGSQIRIFIRSFQI